MSPQEIRNLGPFWPLLHVAIERDMIEMIKVLVENGCPVSTPRIFRKRETSLPTCLEMLEVVLDAGFDVNTNFSEHMGDSLF